MKKFIKAVNLAQWNAKYTHRNCTKEELCKDVVEILTYLAPYEL